MDKLFLGFFFLFLDFNLNFNGASLNLLPEWVGHILLYVACGELLQESELFQKPRPFCAGMCLYTGILWLMALLGIGIGSTVLTVVLGLISTCVSLYIAMLVVDAITNVEMRRNYDLSAAHLRRVWKVLAICSIAAILLLTLPAVALVCVLAAAVAGIVFLAAIHRTRKAYRQMLIEQSKPF